MAQTASRPFDVRAFLQAGSPPRRRTPPPIRLHGRRMPTDPRARVQWRRTYLLLPRAEARCLILAFYRFVELHGRALSWPSDACTLDVVACPAGETVMLGLWSPRAANEFDRFWAKYRSYFYAPEPVRTAAFAGRPALMDG